MAGDSIHAVAFDPRQLGGLRADAARNDPEAVRKAAREFEALLVGQLMKAARATQFAEDLGDSDAMQTFRGLLDEQYAQSVSRGPGLGLADAIVKQIELANPGSRRPEKQP